MAKRLFTSESVTEGHPDKVCDQISDAVLDDILAHDPTAHVACETFTTTGMVTVMGEISTSHYTDIPAIVRRTVERIGYNDPAYGFDARSCAVLTAIDEQSPDIAMGVNQSFEAQNGGADPDDLTGAGDQGMMFGYATNETENYMPLTLDLSHRILLELAKIRREGDAMNYYRKGKLTTYLRPDAKSQVTVEYDDNGRPLRVHTIVVSTQHDEFVEPMDETPEALKSAENEMLAQIRKDVEEVLLPRVIASLPEETQKLFAEKPKLHVNPTGKFVLGGPHADTGLTGRKIIVDTYGGHGAHGGGAFSGKDPSKVDRSAAYACRHIAKNMVAAGVADQVLVQVAYAIGVAEPVSVMVNTYGTAKVSLTDAQIADVIRDTVSLTPKAIEDRLQLRNPIYLETAAYGHMGRQPRRVTKTYTDKNLRDGEFKREVKLFTWEELDLVDTLKKAFKIH